MALEEKNHYTGKTHSITTMSK